VAFFVYLYCVHCSTRLRVVKILWSSTLRVVPGSELILVGTFGRLIWSSSSAKLGIKMKNKDVWYFVLIYKILFVGTLNFSLMPKLLVTILCNEIFQNFRTILIIILIIVLIDTNISIR